MKCFWDSAAESSGLEGLDHQTVPPKASNYNTEEYVTMAQLRESLDQQKDFYRTLLEQQEKSFKSCVQITVDSSNKRIGVKASL